MSDARTTAFTASALKLGLITVVQADECSALHSQLSEMGLAAPIEEVYAKKGYLGKPQLVAIASSVEIGSEHAIPGFDILEKLAEGGMGAVYKARQRSMDRLVAIKMLLPNLQDDPQLRERFIREARAVAKLSHPNVVAGFDVGEAAGVWYFVMEFLDGESLEQRLRKGPLDWSTSLAVMRQVACALEHAHLHGLVHRDVKPSNIMLLTDGTVKLADLGLARTANAHETSLTQSGMVIGSPAYVSPEQAMGDRALDSRSDLFSLGVTWFESLVGERAFLGNNPVSVMSAVLTRDIALEKLAQLNVPQIGIAIIQRLTMRDPNARYAAPKALLVDIDAAKANKPLAFAAPASVTQALSSQQYAMANSIADSKTEIANTARRDGEASFTAQAKKLRDLRVRLLAALALAAALTSLIWLWPTLTAQISKPETPTRLLTAAAAPAFVPGRVDLLSALAIAQALVGDATVYHAEREREIYSIDFAIGKLSKNVEIHAHTGALNAIADEVDDHSVEVATSVVNFTDAINSALRQVPGEVIEAEIVLQPGHSQIDVTIRAAKNIQIVSIDARSGSVIGRPTVR